MTASRLAERLDKAIRAAGVAIVGVSIGSEQDRSTWRVEPATLQAAAQPVIDSFEAPTPNTLLDEAAVRDTSRKELRAVAEALWECIPNPTMTKAQMRVRAIAIYKVLNGS